MPGARWCWFIHTFWGSHLDRKQVFWAYAGRRDICRLGDLTGACCILLHNLQQAPVLLTMFV